MSPQSRSIVRRAAAAASAAFLACSAFAAALAPGEGVLVSLGDEGVAGNSSSYEGAVSNNGKVVAWYSDSTNYVPGNDNNGNYDIFVRDLRTGDTELISADGDGNVGQSWSEYPALSANGRVVLYYTDADNLATGAVNGAQVVAFDRKTGESTEVSLGLEGAPGAGSCNIYDGRPLSQNGRYAVYSSTSTNLVEGDTNDSEDIFFTDILRGETTRISVGTGAEADERSYFPSISPNGRFIVFVSSATNLVAGDTNGVDDVFLFDRKHRTMERVSVADDGSQADDYSGYGAPSVSNNGRLVAFTSDATNLVTGDTNGNTDIYLRDLRAGDTIRVSLGPAGAEPDGDCGDVGITANGRTISYWTYASNLVDATDDIPYDQIVYDVKTGTSRHALLNTDGVLVNGGVYAYFNQMSANGKWLVVASDCDDAVADDANGQWDVFLVTLK